MYLITFFLIFYFFFFFQAEDGIRDLTVTGVQTCALPIWRIQNVFHVSLLEPHHPNQMPLRKQIRPEPEEIEGQKEYEVEKIITRSEERRVGKECRYWWTQ